MALNNEILLDFPVTYSGNQKTTTKFSSTDVQNIVFFSPFENKVVDKSSVALIMSKVARKSLTHFLKRGVEKKIDNFSVVKLYGYAEKNVQIITSFNWPLYKLKNDFNYPSILCCPESFFTTYREKRANEAALHLKNADSKQNQTKLSTSNGDSQEGESDYDEEDYDEEDYDEDDEKHPIEEGPPYPGAKVSEIPRGLTITPDTSGFGESTVMLLGDIKRNVGSIVHILDNTLKSVISMNEYLIKRDQKFEEIMVKYAKIMDEHCDYLKKKNEKKNVVEKLEQNPVQ